MFGTKVISDIAAIIMASRASGSEQLSPGNEEVGLPVGIYVGFGESVGELAGGKVTSEVNDGIDVGVDVCIEIDGKIVEL